MKRYVAHCTACRLTTTGSPAAVRVYDPPGRVLHATRWDLVLNCRGCGLPRSAVLVRVAPRSAYRCGDRCIEATGAECACDCGGRNHGIAFEAVGNRSAIPKGSSGPFCACGRRASECDHSRAGCAR